MKQKLLFINLFAILIFLSCNGNSNENNKQVNSNSEITLENIKKEIIQNDSSILKSDTNFKNDKNTTKTKKSITENENVKKQSLKLQQKKAKIIEEKFKNSKYKNLDCKTLIQKYKSILEEVKSTGNEELLLWKDGNDPIYKMCYQRYTEVFDSLERVENKLGDDLNY